MLKFLVVLLDDTSTSFCHYESKTGQSNLISLEDLRAGLMWAMKENLMVQFVYPDYDLPEAYLNLIDSVDHSDIVTNNHDADVTIYNGVNGLAMAEQTPEYYGILRLDKDTFFANISRICNLFEISIVITDIDSFVDADFIEYKKCLTLLADSVKSHIEKGHSSHVNILTDRIQLSNMNNCNAGVDTITLAPDGKFYICPGFYYDKDENVGDPFVGLDIPNAQLYLLEYAPICRTCDAFHCKRCVWLNKRTTHEINTPSHEQCVTSHIERNTSQTLLKELKVSGIVKIQKEIPEINYLDPFEKLIKN